MKNAIHRGELDSRLLCSHDKMHKHTWDVKNVVYTQALTDKIHCIQLLSFYMQFVL